MITYVVAGTSTLPVTTSTTKGIEMDSVLSTIILVWALGATVFLALSFAHNTALKEQLLNSYAEFDLLLETNKSLMQRLPDSPTRPFNQLQADHDAHGLLDYPFSTDSPRLDKHRWGTTSGDQG